MELWFLKAYDTVYSIRFQLKMISKACTSRKEIMPFAVIQQFHCFHVPSNSSTPNDLSEPQGSLALHSTTPLYRLRFSVSSLRPRAVNLRVCLALRLGCEDWFLLVWPGENIPRKFPDHVWLLSSWVLNVFSNFHSYETNFCFLFHWWSLLMRAGNSMFGHECRLSLQKETSLKGNGQWQFQTQGCEWLVVEALKGSSAGNRQRLDSITQVTPKKFPWTFWGSKVPEAYNKQSCDLGIFEDCHSDLIAGLSCPGNPHKAKQLVPASPASWLRDVSSNRWRCRADLSRFLETQICQNGERKKGSS